MEKLSFKLEVFEGPLDLLLQLIAKNKINIYDIPVAEVLDQYLESIEGMEEIDMDAASEFLTMAAYLLYIKSQMLLPKHEEEPEDPRENLVRMLLEYQRYREVAERFKQMFADAGLRLVRPAQQPEPDPDSAYKYEHSAEELAEAYRAVLTVAKRRLPPPISEFKGIVNTVYTSISTRVVAVLRKLLRQEKINLSDAFEGAGSRSDVVATFLAVLELIGKMRIVVDGDGANVSISLRKDRTDG